MAVTVRKVTIAIGRAEYQWARRRARRDGLSVSAVLSAATREAIDAEEKREQQRIAWEAVSEWILDGNAATPEELEAARRELDGER